jgi:hypothetical protein
VYAGGPAGVTVYQRTGLGTLAATGSGAALADTTDLLLTPDGRDLVVAQFGGRLSYFTAVAGTLTQRAGAAGCMNGDGSGACQALGGLGGNANSRSFLATDASGLDVFATSDTKGMLASVVRDYRPVCHAASVTLPFETATAIHPDCADPNGDPLAYTVTSAPRSGSLSGTFVYTPAAGFSGTDQFTYFATGHGVSSAPATVALGVFRAPPIAPAAPPVVVHTPAPRRTVGALVGTRWEIHGTRFSLLQLTLSQLPKAWAAQIRCAGKHCPFARRTLKGRAKHGTASVLGSLKRSQRRFRAGQTLEVWVSAPGLNTKVARLVLKKGRIPSTQALCAAPGAKKAASRCG